MMSEMERAVEAATQSLLDRYPAIWTRDRAERIVRDVLDVAGPMLTTSALEKKADPS